MNAHTPGKKWLDDDEGHVRRHTPGPWVVSTGSYPHIDTRDGIAIAKVDCSISRLPGHWIDNKESAAANARLIAAAPELLEALEIAEATLQRIAPDGSRATQGTRDVIRAAIQKAAGGAS